MSQGPAREGDRQQQTHDEGGLPAASAWPCGMYLECIHVAQPFGLDLTVLRPPGDPSGPLLPGLPQEIGDHPYRKLALIRPQESPVTVEIGPDPGRQVSVPQSTASTKHDASYQGKLPP